MKRYRALLIALTVLVVGAVQARAADSRRVALIVGNGAYVSAPRLGNTVNDARLIARTLGGLGFSLVGDGPRTDLDKAGFDAAVQAFHDAIRGADVAVFYYAGHGMQVRGANWLVPLDANPRFSSDLPAQMVDASRILRDMEDAHTKLNVLVLDACRNNPFFVPGLGNSETGLAAMQPGGRAMRPADRGFAAGLAAISPPEGTVIAFATQPGNVALDGAGSDSPYSLALEEAMRQRGLNVLSMFNRVGVAVKRATNGAQQPWVSNSPIEGDYAFAGPGAGVVTVGVVASPVGRAATSVPIPANLLDLVAARAAAMGVPAPPPMRIYSPGADVPPEIARFAGAWGPGGWFSEPGTNFILLIDSVDAKGNAHIIRLTRGECDTVECPKRPPKVIVSMGKIDAGVLTFSERSGAVYKFEIGLAGWLHGTTGPAGGQQRSSGPLTRIE